MDEIVSELQRYPDQLRYVSWVSYAFFIFRILVCIFSLHEFRKRDSAISKANNETEVMKEHKRWQLKFGKSGIVGFIGEMFTWLAISFVSFIVVKRMKDISIPMTYSLQNRIS